MNDDAEIQAFKHDIDLRHYAASLGYELDKRDSWRGSSVMRRGGDKIVVRLNSNGHYVYFSVRDDQDNGTIIDFVQRRQTLNLGEVRKTLRPWIGRPSVPSLPSFPKLEPVTKDRMGVELAYRRMSEALRHPYLEQERCLPAAVLSVPRFTGRIRIDSRGNAVFPHFDAEGLCGYEIKNRGFTGFAAGGEKGLWFSHTNAGDRRLVLAESAIDALSHAVLFPDADNRTRYASLGGKPNPKQPGLVKAAALRLPAGSEIVAAFDDDKDGRALVEVVRQVVETVAGISLCVHLPGEAKDWNDVLRKSAARSSPIAPDLASRLAVSVEKGDMRVEERGDKERSR